MFKILLVSLSIIFAELPNDVRWVTASNEYNVLCNQIYFDAWDSIKDLVLKTSDPIIIMDLDETVLDNSKYQIIINSKNEKYNPKSWSKWVNKMEASLVPGAKEFILKYKDVKGAKIIYISNRMDKNLIPTQKNMKKLGIFFEDDIFLLRLDNQDKKTVRRKEVFNGTGRMKKYGKNNVIAYFGDAMGDFPDDLNYIWSKNKFIFPNPMYGKW
tara:strand:- start:61 stop:699 length:639 start_codon:yes stop_codon:yes gene_type:complete